MGDTRTVGHVEAIFRYPVKSMAGERLTEARLGWHGLEGDRRFAFRRLHDGSGMPWLTATKLPDLLRFLPLRRDEGAVDGLVTHVRAPDGRDLPVRGAELAAEIAEQHGSPVEMMQLDQGIFDDGRISLITAATLREIGTACGCDLDVRRFRPNLLIRTEAARAFEEDDWIGGVLSFGDDDDRGEVNVTTRDERCSMINLDPDSARSDPRVLKAVVRLHDNHAGVYAVVTRRGRISAGQEVRLSARSR